MDSLSPAYFKALYERDSDPWNFQDSAYESAKYAETISILKGRRYQHGFEIGGSIGILTRHLAGCCEHLLSVDVSERAQGVASGRCADRPEVSFALMQVPHQLPSGKFDLIILSEVGYYWSEPDLDLACKELSRRLTPGGHLLLVHWRGSSTLYPSNGEKVHQSFLNLPGLSLVRSQPTQAYLLDLLQRDVERS